MSSLSGIRSQTHKSRRRSGHYGGTHNLRMSDPSSSGKTLIVRAMPGILPKLDLSEGPDITRIYSVADMLSPNELLIRQRPFRAPHHTISCAGLIGGGRYHNKPGEISLAHRGLLFLLN